MKNQIKNSLLLIIFSFSIICAQSVQKFAEIGDLKLISGESIKNCKIGYRTFGTINDDSSNVIIYPTWFEGTTEGISILIQKYKFIDTTKYFIIAYDALSNGVSSSPSNYDKMANGVFPQITIRDMVNSQHKLVTEIFGLKHLFAAVGGSLGGMQVLELAVAYPEFVSNIVSYVGSPRMSSYDLLWMNTQLNIIETGKRNGIKDQEIRKSLAMLMAGLARTPQYMIEKIKPKNFAKYLLSFDKESTLPLTVDDYLYQIKAMMKHDISIDFDGSLDDAAKQIKAKLFMIISENDLLVNPMEAKNFAIIADAKTLILHNNCGHLAVSCELDRCRKEIAEFLCE